MNGKFINLYEYENRGPIAAIRDTLNFHGSMEVQTEQEINDIAPKKYSFLEMGVTFFQPKSVAAAVGNSTAYQRGDSVVSTNGYQFFCTKAGTSSGSAAALPTAPTDGQVYSDGTVEFTYHACNDNIPVGSLIRHLVLNNGNGLAASAAAALAVDSAAIAANALVRGNDGSVWKCDGTGGTLGTGVQALLIATATAAAGRVPGTTTVTSNSRTLTYQGLVTGEVTGVTTYMRVAKRGVARWQPITLGTAV